MSAAWVFLGAMIGAYGLANMLQSKAAVSTAAHETLDPKLLVRLARQGVYLLGIGCQTLGFLLAFAARRDLPLFLVQGAVAAGLGLTAILGVLFLHWRLPRSEIALLGILVLGLAGLVLAAQPHPSRPIGPMGVVLLVVALGFISITGIFAAKIQGTKGSVALGGLAGVAFGAAAVASRPLAGVVTNHGVFSAHVLLTDPLLYLLIAHSLVGQLLLGLAMQRGSTTAAVAAMDAAAAVPAAVIGLLFLGDRIAPGRQWYAIAGFLLTLGAVIGLTFFAEPQHHHQLGQSRVAAARGATGPSQAALGAVAMATVTTGAGARAKASRTVRMSHARARVRARNRARTVAVRWPQR